MASVRSQERGACLEVTPKRGHVRRVSVSRRQRWGLEFGAGLGFAAGACAKAEAISRPRTNRNREGSRINSILQKLDNDGRFGCGIRNLESGTGRPFQACRLGPISILEARLEVVPSRPPPHCFIA